MSDERTDRDAEHSSEEQAESSEGAKSVRSPREDDPLAESTSFVGDEMEETETALPEGEALPDGVILPEGADSAVDEAETELLGISTSRSEKREGDADSDSAAIPDEPSSAASARKPLALRDWSSETSSRAVAVELKRIESEVRSILQDRDPKRKRKLAGTHRWEELEEDLLSWQFTGPIDDATNKELRLLVRRRHYLFNRLRFLSRTRPTWNS